MTAPFTGKPIFDAYFTNEANDTVEVVYNDGTEDQPIMISVFVPATLSDHYMMKALIDAGFDYEQIAVNTVNRKRYESAMWNTIIKRAAAEEIRQIKQDYQTKLNEFMTANVVGSGDIIGAILKHNNDKDALFHAKLAVFDLPEIKNIKDRAIKQRIRTAQSFLFLVKELADIIK